jgi:DNA-binding GntR family transcriptional regulator
MQLENLAQILTPTVKRPLADEVAERLRDAILHGQLAPEEPLREATLSELMGVSRGPIREALTILEREGLVVTTPTGRTYVARLSHEELDDVFSLRKALERLAVEYACVRATPEDLERVQAVVDDMANAAEQDLSAKRMAELDMRFHEAVYQAAHHQRLLDFWNTLRPQMYVFLLSRNAARDDYREQAVQGHQEILDAINAGDKDLALQINDRHMGVAYNLVSGSYDQTASPQ